MVWRMWVHQMEPQKEWPARNSGQPFTGVLDNYLRGWAAPHFIERKRTRRGELLTGLKVKLDVQRANRLHLVAGICGTSISASSGCGCEWFRKFALQKIAKSIESG